MVVIIEMSWLNATNFTSLAKNVLREAQKTIDKALDITEQEQQQRNEMLEEPAQNKTTTVVIGSQPEKETKLGPEKTTSQLKASVWGSFSGSFFENSLQAQEEEEEGKPSISQPTALLEEPVSSQPANLTPEPPVNKVVQDWNADWENQPLVSLPDTPPPEASPELSTPSEETPTPLKSLSLPLQSPNSPDVAILTPSPSLVEFPSSASSSSIEIIPSPLTSEGLMLPPPVELDNSPTGQDNTDESAAESFHSSLSASSSLTVISPDTDTAGIQEPPSDSLLASAPDPAQQESGFGSIEDAKSVTSQTSNTSSDVKKLLEDAFQDPQPMKGTREASPSSSDRSILKMECEFPSGQTSGDEVETTTSSDIEVVSSPNGERRIHYSGVPHHGSRCQGHKREPSNISVGSDESCSPATDNLMKRLADLSRVLEARETKLIELSRLNAALEEENTTAKSKLDGLEKMRETEANAIRRMTEDFAQRFSNMEKKLQQANLEKETLSMQYEQLKNEKTSVEDLKQQLADKDKLADELREEGEKLSKKQLLMSNLIKKMRTKEKETENAIQNQNEQIEDLSRDVERLKKSLAAKEELERSQIEAVRQLTQANSQFDKELQVARSQMKELLCETDILRATAERAAKELEDFKTSVQVKEAGEAQKVLSLELSVRQELQVALEEAKQRHMEEQQQLLARMEELNRALTVSEAEHGKQVEVLRQEGVRLMQRLEQAERAVHAQNNDIAAATKPLLRQIEALQASLTAQRTNEEKLEQALTAKLNEAQRKCERATEKEKQALEAYVALQSKTSLWEQQIRLLSEDKSRLEFDLTRWKEELEKKESVLEKHRSELDGEKTSLTFQMADLKQQMVSLQQELAIERTALEAERQKCLHLQAKSAEPKSFSHLEPQIQDVLDETPSNPSHDLETPRQSPTPSLSRLSGSNSLTESFTSNPWAAQDDIFEGGITTPVPRNSTFDVLRGGTSVLENLQAQLKLREGEVSQLQLELLHQERTRESLTQELSKLLSVNETLANQAQELEALKALHADLETKYNALLQLYGEKIEETEELRLDLLDVKEMYKAQIDQLLRS